MSKSSAAVWGDDAPSPAQLKEFFAQIESGRIKGSGFQLYLRHGPPIPPRVNIVPSPAFFLMADLGTIIVPKDYVHGERLRSFEEKYHKMFYGYDEVITDRNYPNPSHILKPGDKLNVRAFNFKQTADPSTKLKEVMAFLATQNAVYTGAQGVSLVWAQKRRKLPVGYWLASFDEEDCLYKDVHDRPMVPIILSRTDGAFKFSTTIIGRDWNENFLFLCFCLLPA